MALVDVGVLDRKRYAFGVRQVFLGRLEIRLLDWLQDLSDIRHGLGVGLSVSSKLNIMDAVGQKVVVVALRDHGGLADVHSIVCKCLEL